MRANSFSRRARVIAAISVPALTSAATALAAHPKAGRKYAGFTSEAKVEGFGAPVSFTVSGTAAKLGNFRYGSLGCFGAGGFRPGVDPFTGSSITKVGTISVASSGHFAITGATSSYQFRGSVHGTLTTTSAVSGRFLSAGRATGKITFTQTQRVKHQKPFSCGPAMLSFTVKLS